MPRYSFKKMPLLTRSFIICGCSLILSLMLCIFASIIAKSSNNPSENLSLYGEICFLITMLFCGFSGAKTAVESRFASGIIPAAIMLAIIFATSLCFGGTSFMKEFILAIIGAVIAAAGAFMGAKEKKRGRRK